ncbi:unnamed protein product [Nyctereutes procyonoides]|uniref:(raccoon dog) hypothetical protein n=1 Tax=Nyctereutes procyonoides TaxID=34880 RepID=A0A811ZHF1_NYCPR|nr:unnamed protein product [Nyctereutes procyonoides]CAD7688258.1 unnamed protein product [Nyctereutes procyonoides]
MQSLGQWQQPLVPGQNPGKVKVVVLHSGSLRQGCRYAGPTSHLKRCLKRRTVHACDSACFLLTEQCRAMFTGTERDTEKTEAHRDGETDPERPRERDQHAHRARRRSLMGFRPVIVAGSGCLQGEKLCPGEPDCPGHRRQGARGTCGQGVELAGQMRGVSAHGSLHGLAGCCQHQCPGAGQLGRAHDANTHGAPALGPCRGVGLSLRQAPYTRHGALPESKPPQTLFQGERPRDGSVSLEVLFAPKICCFHQGKPLAKRMNLESTCNMLFITKSVRILAGCPQPRVGLLSPAWPWVLLALLCPLGMSASSNPTTVTPLKGRIYLVSPSGMRTENYLWCQAP